jgi:hypothetical protein
VFRDAGDHQKPIDRRIDPACAEKDVVSRLPCFRQPCDAFENRADIVTGLVPQPVLNAIEDWLGIRRYRGILPAQKLPDRP